MDEKKYITQLNKEDLRDLAAATNPTPGFMIRVEKTPGELKISVDENSLKQGIIAFLNNLRWSPGYAPSAGDICNTPMTPA